jgi:hypothetical protein
MIRESPVTVKETGRKFITPCCTASTIEYVDESGHTWLRSQVVGHGWTSDYFRGAVDEINDGGTVVEADGSERRVYWRDTNDPMDPTSRAFYERRRR